MNLPDSPERKLDTSIEVISLKNDHALEIIDQLLEDENIGKAQDLSVLANEEERRERRDHSLLLAQVHLVLRQIELHGDKNNSFLCVAKIDERVIGISIAGLDKDKKSIGFFTGVIWKFRRRGISTELTKRRIFELSKKGIHEYDLEMWKGSLAVARKLEREGLIDIIGPLNNSKSYKITIRTRE